MIRGRASVLEAVEKVVDGCRAAQGGGLLLRGEEGSGKTSLLDHAMSRSSDLVVLRCGGTAAEEHVPYAALHQLIRPLLPMIDELPHRQCEALKAALSFHLQRNNDRFVVPLAVLDLLSEHARSSPTLMLVDDAHLVDHESASVLAFVAHRLHNESISLVMAARVVDDYAFALHGVSTLDLLPLDSAAVADILFDRTGERPSPDVVEEVLTASLGNPKAASMLASWLAADQVAGRAPLPAPLPLAPSHEAPLLARLRELPRATQTLLLIAALEESGDSMKVFAAAQRLGLSVISTLEPAESIGVIDVDGVSVTFREPLMREAIKRAASFRDRRAVHLAIAALLDAEGDHEMSVWHAAQATLGPDESLAAELEEAASELRRSSGCALAAEVLQRAADLSQDNSRKAFRLMLASEAAWMAGQMTRSLALADAAIASRSATSTVRVRASFTQGYVMLHQGKAMSGVDALVKAAGTAESIDPLMGIGSNLLAARAAFLTGDLERTGVLMRRAANLPPGSEERTPYQFGFCPETAPYVAHDAASRVACLGEAVATAVDRVDVRWLTLASQIATCYGDERSTVRFAERALRCAREEGATGFMPELLVTIAAENKVLDRSAAVEADAEEALRLAEEMGQGEVTCHASSLLAWVTAIQGRRDETIAHANRCISLAKTFGYSYFGTVARRWLAVLDMGMGNHEQAYHALAALQRDNPETHPVVALWSIPELVESGVRSKRDPAAISRIFRRYEEWVARNQSPMGVAMRDHCYGLLLDGSESIEAFERALDALGDERGFAQARTQLALGESLRRNRRRNDARVYLRAAVEAFEIMGAVPWARRARDELRASGEGGVRPAASDGRLEMLTPQELQIARLVALGMSNREVAAKLFLSHRTVEYHLHKMYTKLDVNSRSDLVRLAMGVIDLDEAYTTEIQR